MNTDSRILRAWFWFSWALAWAAVVYLRHELPWRYIAFHAVWSVASVCVYIAGRRRMP